MGKIHPDQKIVLVTGKGGVGKSTISALLAHSLARTGKSVLLVELGETSTIKRSMQTEVTYSPTPITENLKVCLFTGESCLREFITHYIRLQAIVNLFFDNKVMRSLVKAAPALKELAILGKITSGVRGIGPDFPFDVIVVDGYPTGHFQGLIMAPKAMGEIIDLGPMGEQSRGIDRTLKEAKITTILNVTLAEEMPIAESIDFIRDMKSLGFPEPKVVINKWVDVPKVSGDTKPDGFLEYLKLICDRQARASSAFNGKPPTKIPFDFRLDLLRPLDSTIQLMEGLCKSILPNTK